MLATRNVGLFLKGFIYRWLVEQATNHKERCVLCISFIHSMIIFNHLVSCSFEILLDNDTDINYEVRYKHSFNPYNCCMTNENILSHNLELDTFTL